MGAIIRLWKMPDRCSNCPFANDEASFCRLRNASIIAGKKRDCRMPLCPLINEGEYLSRQAKAIKHLVGNIHNNTELMNGDAKNGDSRLLSAD